MSQSTPCISKLEALKQLPHSLHILCPRQSEADNDRYDDDPLYESASPEEPAPSPARASQLSQSSQRRDDFMESFMIFAYDGDDAKPYKDYVLERLDAALGSCDLCIRNYYICKPRLRAQLQKDYDDDDVALFFQIFDEKEVERIKSGLQRACKTLINLPEQKRKIRSLDKTDLFAVFEALSCDAFLRNEDLLKQYFDEPFRLLQPRRPLNIGDYVPAATSFLFSQETFRRDWAVATYSNNIQRPPLDVEFETAIKPTLEKQLKEILFHPTAHSILRFWFGMKHIAQNLEKRQITHHLRALDKDVCMLAIEHLSINAGILRFVLQTMTILLNKAPDDFWDAMGAMPHTALIEAVFGNAYFDKCLYDHSDTSDFSESALFDMLSWIAPFMAAVKPANQPTACRTMTRMLMAKASSTKASSSAKYQCLQCALNVLVRTFASFMDEQGLKQGAIARVVIAETRDTVIDHFETIIKPLPEHTNAEEVEILKTASLDVIRYSLDVECLFLRLDFLSLLNNETISGQKRICDKLWNSVATSLSNENWQLSSAVLLGFTPLVGLEKFSKRAPGGLTPEREDFNRDFDQVHGFMTTILDRLAGFSPNHLDEIYKSQRVSMSAISGLFSSESNVFGVTVDMIKTVSGETSRREALAHLVEAFLATITYAFCWCMRRIGGMKTFAPVPRSIKTAMDILDVLCDPSSGMLRRGSTDARESDAVRQYWRYQWYLLGTVFKCTEQWSNVVSDKEKMTDLCRDAMQLAEALFSQYDVFAAASLHSAKEGETPDRIKKGLLDASAGSPAMALDGMSKWLRLKDEYLVVTCVNLVSMLLRRLGEKKVAVAQETLSYIEEISLSSSTRSKLSPQQKAELIRSLEAYSGKKIEALVPPKKQGTLNQFIANQGKAEAVYDLTKDEFDDDGGISDDILQQLSSSVEANKALRPQKPLPKPTSRLSKPVKQEQPDRKAFIEERKRLLEASKLRNKEAAALLRGQTGIGAETKSQGSGLNGIGVKGKDHTKTPKDGLMVSSESESESDDETDKVLYGDNMRKVTFSRSRVAQAPAPIKIAKQQRNKKDIRARLSPDLSGLHKIILSWDFYADSKYPPTANVEDHSSIQNTFPTALAWQNSFEPMLILEAWQTFCATRDDRSFKPFEIKVANRLSVDSFIEVGTAMSFAEGKDLGISEGDIVLFSKNKQQGSGPTCLSRVHKISRKRAQMEISYKVASIHNTLASSLVPGAEIFGSKLLSLTPLEREYGVLPALQYYDLCVEVVKAKPSPILDYPDAALMPLTRTYNVNQAQAKAVKSAIDNDAFTLIQGPPGSGKTKTICAVVGALLTDPSRRGAPIANMVGGRPQPPNTRKIMVCAPSNAAVDELVMRFRKGVTTLDGSTINISVVRLGRSDAINAQVKDLTLDELVSAKMNAAAPQVQNQKPLHEIMMEHKDASEKFLAVREKLDISRGKGEPVKAADEREFELWKKKKADLGKIIDERRDKENSASRNEDIAKNKFRHEIMRGADIVCATLSGSGHDMLREIDFEFEAVIIDEAAQCVELSALIPLKYGCSKCILVGDPKQLPPTMFSREAAQFLYERSLFARMAENHPKDVHLLDTQYRMHPHISAFPSRSFYDGRLRDGVTESSRFMPWHHSSLLGPYRFFNVQGSSTRDSRNSLVNAREAEVVMQLYHRLITDCAGYQFSGKIGVITPYKGQLKLLRQEFSRRYGEGVLSAVEFNTTDAFQGRESEIIIFSCVRSRAEGSRPEGIGFLKDIRRMNVGLTRAKSSLWVLGDAGALAKGEYWKKLVEDAKNRNLFSDGDGDVMRLLQRPLLTQDMMKPDIEMMDTGAPTPPAVANFPSDPPPPLRIIEPEDAKAVENRKAEKKEQNRKENEKPVEDRSRTSTPAGEKRKRESGSEKPDARLKATRLDGNGSTPTSTAASRSVSREVDEGLPNLRGDDDNDEQQKQQQSRPGTPSAAARGPGTYGNGPSLAPKVRPQYTAAKKKSNADALFLKSKKKF